MDLNHGFRRPSTSAFIKHNNRQTLVGIKFQRIKPFQRRLINAGAVLLSNLPQSVSQRLTYLFVAYLQSFHQHFLLIKRMCLPGNDVVQTIQYTFMTAGNQQTIAMRLRRIQLFKFRNGFSVDIKRLHGTSFLKRYKKQLKAFQTAFKLFHSASSLSAIVRKKEAISRQPFSDGCLHCFTHRLAKVRHSSPMAVICSEAV